MLEDKQKETTPGEVLSATDQGITITAVQSIVDSYGADLFFRVEGFTLPEGRNPELFWDRDDVTIDGSTEFYSSMTGWFYDGTTRNEAGEWVYASNGQPSNLEMISTSPPFTNGWPMTEVWSIR